MYPVYEIWLYYFDVTLSRPTIFFIWTFGAIALGPSLVGKKIVLFFKDSQAKDYEIFCSEAIRRRFWPFWCEKKEDGGECVPRRADKFVTK